MVRTPSSCDSTLQKKQHMNIIILNHKQQNTSKKVFPFPLNTEPLDSNYNEIQLKENKGKIQHIIELKINMVK